MNRPKLHRTRLALAALAVALGGLLTPPAAPAADDAPRASFLLPVLPDTQFYSRYDADTAEGNQFRARFGSEPFSTQTQWLVDNRDALHMPFVVHVGDIVDQVNQTKQWPIASSALGILETAHMPYSILTGNHDVLDSSRTDAQRVPANEPYLKTFSTARAAAQSTFGGRDATGLNEWHTFTAEGRTFLVLALGWNASDATLAWANQVIADHPGLPTILTSHELLNIAGDAVSPLEVDYGKRLWDKLIRGNDQIFLTFNGHYHGVSHLRKTNDFGHSVDEIVIDYQMAYMGGNGYMGLYELDFTNNRLRSTVVSPWVPKKPQATLVPEFDQAISRGPMQQLDLPLDYAQRFAGFSAPVAPPVATHGSLIAAAEQKIVSGYTEPTPPVRAPAHDADDYPHVTGTLAHWRFGDQPTGAIAPGATVTDVTGQNPMARAALNIDGVTGAQVDDLQRSSDHAYLSSDGGSACFTNTTKSPLRASWLTTAADAPVNVETFPDGYTIETFVKIAPGWTADRNRWMGALTRDGRQGDAGNFGDVDDPLFTIAISNLREVQFNASTQTPKANKTNWSGEVMNDTWLHLAAVNDPTTKVTTLYVNGAPVLRNNSGAVGLATANKPWRLGTAMYGAQTDDGWLGCIGETRIVDHPLAPSEWLTARTYVPPPSTPAPPVATTPAAGATTTPTATTPSTSAPAPTTAPSTPTTTPAPARVRISAVAVDGRRLTLRVSQGARVTVTLRGPRGRTVTLHGRARRAGALSLALPRSLKPGRYRVAIRASADGRTTTRAATVRVGRR